MRNEERKRVWVDRFQTRLALRIGAYLALFLVVLINLLLSWKLATEGSGDPFGKIIALFRESLPLGVCLLILIPAMAWDAIRFTHRIVGPLVRFRQTIQSLARGEAVRPIKLRKGDYLNELRDDFNQLLDALQRRGVPVLKPDAPAGADEDSQRRPA